MTVTTLSPPDLSRTHPGRRHVVVLDPGDGTTVEVAVGHQLALRFRPRVVTSGWRASDRPDHLVPLVAEAHELCFLVFAGETTRLRLERVAPGGDQVLEAREVCVVAVPVDGDVNARSRRRAARGRTARSASPRTASR